MNNTADSPRQHSDVPDVQTSVYSDACASLRVHIVLTSFSYSGLHCVEIKGRSKSVGYEPGMKFEGDMFRNTWNAVLIDGEWRLVQCNWGARSVLHCMKVVVELSAFCVFSFYRCPAP